MEAISVPLEAISVPLVAALLVAAGALGVFTSLAIRRSALLAAIGAAVMVMGAAILFTGPPTTPPPYGQVATTDVGGRANFLTLWDKNRALLGAPIGRNGSNIEMRQQIMVAWFTQARIESHPEISNEHWGLQPGNLGLEIMEASHIPVEANPSVPPIVASFLQSEAARGEDVLWVYGLPRTSPIKDGDAVRMYFDKSVLEWPSSAMDVGGDPGSIKRVPVGTIAYELEHDGVNLLHPDPWTSVRRALLLAAAAAMLLVALGPRIAPALFRGRRGAAAF